jgi:hypothetical protein
MKKEDEVRYCLFLKSGKFILVDRPTYESYLACLFKKESALMWGDKFEFGSGCIPMECIEGVVRDVHFKQAL